MRIGCQVSVALGYETVIREAGHAGLQCLQVFSRNPVGGQSTPLPTAGSLRPMLEKSRIGLLIVHAPYFVNPAAAEIEKQQRARQALKEEMRRAKILGAGYVVLHPGHWSRGSDRHTALEVFVGTLTTMLQAPGRVLVENTAGQGREIGDTWDELAELFRRIGQTRRVGLMLDTAHVMAAGHALSRPADVESLLGQIDEKIGLERVVGIHLNDSLHPVGSHRDQHAHLLSGSMTECALRRLVQWAEARECPLVLETPGRTVGDRAGDLEILKAFSRT